jgi:DNA (cytosine-5)-methyltransferase 1
LLKKIKFHILFFKCCATVRVIEAILPDHIIIENVRGFQNARDKDGELYLSRMIKQLKALNYSIWHGVLNAFDYSVPQKRERYFILGSRTITPLRPEPTERIGYKEVLDNMDSRNDTKHSQEMIDRFLKLPFNIWCKLDPTKKYKTAYRLDPKTPGIPAPTICNLDKFWVVWGDRVLNIDESLALQTLPTDYVLKGTKKDKQRGIGNVLPAKLAYAVARQFFERS